MNYNLPKTEYLQSFLMPESEPMSVVMEVLSVKQVVTERPKDYDKYIMSSTHAGNVGMREIGEDASETLLVCALSTKNEINALHKVFAGSLNTTVAHPREIFRTAILNNAASIIIYHNHPSGDCSPSEADLSFTRRLVEAGDILGINVIDHIIVSRDGYLSLREENMM